MRSRSRVQNNQRGGTMAQIERTLTGEEIQGSWGDRGGAEWRGRVLNEVLETEMADHLGADPHGRTDGGRGWRNGPYERSPTTGEGRSGSGCPGMGTAPSGRSYSSATSAVRRSRCCRYWRWW